MEGRVAWSAWRDGWRDDGEGVGEIPNPKSPNPKKISNPRVGLKIQRPGGLPLDHFGV